MSTRRVTYWSGFCTPWRIDSSGKKVCISRISKLPLKDCGFRGDPHTTDIPLIYHWYTTFKYYVFLYYLYYLKWVSLAYQEIPRIRWVYWLQGKLRALWMKLFWCWRRNLNDSCRGHTNMYHAHPWPMDIGTGVWRRSKLHWLNPGWPEEASRARLQDKASVPIWRYMQLGYDWGMRLAQAFVRKHSFKLSNLTISYWFQTWRTKFQ